MHLAIQMEVVEITDFMIDSYKLWNAKEEEKLKFLNLIDRWD